MELLLNYLIKSGLCLLVLYLFYYALLRKQPNFAFNRLFLLLATPLALFIPILKWPASLATETAVTQSLRAIQLPEIAITATAQHTASDAVLTNIPVNYILLGIYCIGTALLLLKLCRQLYSIRKMAVKATPVLQKQGITVLETSDNAPTFAFLSYVFISQQHHLSDTEKKQVLDHELAHVQLRHTLDVLYFEVLTALLWFNPVIWLLKNELRDVHEYQADARVLSKHQVSQYSSLLSKEVLYKAGIPVGSYFGEPQVFKRLRMLHKNGKQNSWLRTLLLFPLLGGLAFIFSSQQLNTSISSSLPKESVSTLMGETDSEDLPHIEVEGTTAEQEATDQNKESVISSTKFIEPETGSEQEQIESETEQQEAEPVAPATATATEERPYTYVEQMPEFSGGELALQKFIAKNIRYPEAAVKAGKEGIVFISFTISKEGVPTEYEIVKGVSDEINAEALRVFKLTEGSWKPGRQNGKVVPVRFTLPIRFALTY